MQSDYETIRSLDDEAEGDVLGVTFLHPGVGSAPKPHPTPYPARTRSTHSTNRLHPLLSGKTPRRPSTLSSISDNSRSPPKHAE